MSIANTNTASTVVALADGLGTISFVATDSSTFGQLRMDGQVLAIKGVYSSVSVIAECEDFVLSLNPVARPGNGPRLRGKLVRKSTQEAWDISAWAPTKGGKAYGLSFDTRAPVETHLPF